MPEGLLHSVGRVLHGAAMMKHRLRPSADVPLRPMLVILSVAASDPTNVSTDAARGWVPSTLADRSAALQMGLVLIPILLRLA